LGSYTPMMQQYLEIKKEYSGYILFYRLGDFYEMFFEDAIQVSKELELTLTGKNCGVGERAPMCGVPYHSVEGYLNKLVKRGYKIAVCEQVEDPKAAKGIVKREVIRIVTPGTNTDTQALEETRNNYIMCIVYLADKYGVSIADVSTGDYYVTEVDTERKLLDEMNKYNPAELICNEAFFMSGIDLDDIKNRLNVCVSALESWYFGEDTAVTALKEHFKIQNLAGIGLEDFACRVTGENLPLMKVSMNGDSVTYFANKGQHIVIYHLEIGETISVESENILAFTQDCDYNVRFIGVGVLSQKGLATSTLTGRGREAYVAVLSDGNPIVLSNVSSRSTISVDPDAVICWIGNGHCDPRVTLDVSWKTFIRQTSGESYQFEWNGNAGVTVVLQPSERQSGLNVSMD